MKSKKALIKKRDSKTRNARAREKQSSPVFPFCTCLFLGRACISHALLFFGHSWKFQAPRILVSLSSFGIRSSFSVQFDKASTMKNASLVHSSISDNVILTSRKVGSILVIMEKKNKSAGIHKSNCMGSFAPLPLFTQCLISYLL